MLHVRCADTASGHSLAPWRQSLRGGKGQASCYGGLLMSNTMVTRERTCQDQRQGDILKVTQYVGRLSTQVHSDITHRKQKIDGWCAHHWGLGVSY